MIEPTLEPDEREPQLLPPIRHPQLGAPVVVYEYQRASGDVAFVNCRFEPKNFRVAQPRGDGWVWHLEGAPFLPYRYPGLLEALGAGETVWVADGEKDCDALTGAGACATCCARAQGWNLELAELLTGARRVRIVADLDANGTGVRQTLEVRDLLVRAGAVASSDIELVRAREGKDAFAHFDAGCSLDDFELLPESATEPALAAAPSFPAIDLEVFLARPPEPPDWDLEGWFARGDLVLVFGDPGVGKSLWALALAIKALPT